MLIGDFARNEWVYRTVQPMDLPGLNLVEKVGEERTL